MIKLVVTNEKNLELYELEKVHVGENKFGYYLIFLPEVLNTYNLSNCEVKLIQIFEDNTSVAINVDTTQETRPIKEFITLDATAQAQTVTLSVLITHNGDVIGKTNQKTYQVYPTKNFTPIDPREDLDEIIAELRADNAQLEETVSEQTAEITEKNARITELSNQVDDLTEENAEQAETITRQNTTIDQLNSRVPALQQLDPINPSGVQQTYNPESPNIGFPQVIVNPVTAEGLDFDFANLKKDVEFLGGVGTYDPFPDHSIGGIYLFSEEENAPPTICKIVNFYSVSGTFPFSFYYNNKVYFPYLKRIEFINCPMVTEIPQGLIQGYVAVEEVILPTNIKTINNIAFANSGIKILNIPDGTQVLSNQMCYACVNLKTLYLPNTLITIQGTAFQGCPNLEFVTLENGFNCSITLSYSTLYSHDTILSWFNALADRTGQTAYTLTIGTTNLNKMTAEEKAIATNKNWNLA